MFIFVTNCCPRALFFGGGGGELRVAAGNSGCWGGGVVTMYDCKVCLLVSMKGP